MKNKKILLSLVVLFGCIMLNGATAMDRWDTSLYLTTVESEFKIELEEEFKKLFEGCSRKTDDFSQSVIEEIREMVTGMMSEIASANVIQDLFSDSDFKEKLQLFKDKMTEVAELLKKSEKRISIYRIFQNNKASVNRALELLKDAQCALIRRIGYLRGDDSPELRRRQFELDKVKREKEILKNLYLFVTEARKSEKERFLDVYSLDAMGFDISNNIGCLDQEKLRVFNRYYEKIKKEKGEKDGVSALMRGEEVIFQVPREDGGNVFFHYKPARTTIL